MGIQRGEVLKYRPCPGESPPPTSGWGFQVTENGTRGKAKGMKVTLQSLGHNLREAMPRERPSLEWDHVMVNTSYHFIS